MSPPQFPQIAVSAAIFRDGKVLLVRRARPPGKGLHSLPGGRIAFGETVAAALHREVAEETGLEIEIACLASIAWNGHITADSGPLCANRF